MWMIKVTELLSTRDLRDVVINSEHIEYMFDEETVVGFRNDQAEKSRVVQIHMTSGKIMQVRYNGDAMDFANRLHTRRMTYPQGVSRNISDWSWKLEEEEYPAVEQLKLDFDDGPERERYIDPYDLNVTYRSWINR